MNFFLLFSIFILLSFSSVYDIKYHRIPNFITFPAILIAILYHIYNSGYDGFRFSLLGAFTGIGLLIAPYFLGKMGAGDAKLLGAVGAFIGAKGIIISFLFTAVAGGIYALFVMILYKNENTKYLTNYYYRIINFTTSKKFVSIKNQEDARQRTKLSYGLAIAAGTGIFVIFSETGIRVLPF